MNGIPKAYSRRATVNVSVGGVPVGSRHPIVVQSMTNTDTADPASTAEQVAALAAGGSELVRITVNNDEAAPAVPEIVERLARPACQVPVIGDFHYNGHLLLTKYPDCARALAKYRINPGNVGAKRRDENFRTIVEAAIEYGKPVRIGVNWGSLDQQLLTEMMDEKRAARTARCEDGDDGSDGGERAALRRARGRNRARPRSHHPERQGVRRAGPHCGVPQAGRALRLPAAPRL